MASLEQPEYTAKITTASEELEFDLGKSGIITDLTLSDSPDSLAVEADMTIINANYKGKPLSKWITPLSKLTIKADVGEGKFRIFVGVIWEGDDEAEQDAKVSYTAYDFLIFAMKSEDWFFYKKGLQTKNIMKKICSAWGLKLRYEYGSIKHGRIKPVKNKIGDMMVWVLNKAKDELDARYILTIDGTTVVVKYTGVNSTVYCLEKGKNATYASRKMSLEETVTKIKIYGEQKKKTVPKKAEVVKNTADYGTIQQVMDNEKKQKLAKLKKKAKQTLKKKAKPQYTEAITAISNPLIRRGDKVYVNAGGISGDRIVKSISHDCMARTMDLGFY